MRVVKRTSVMLRATLDVLDGNDTVYVTFTPSQGGIVTGSVERGHPMHGELMALVKEYQ